MDRQAAIRVQKTSRKQPRLNRNRRPPGAGTRSAARAGVAAETGADPDRGPESDTAAADATEKEPMGMAVPLPTRRRAAEIRPIRPIPLVPPRLIRVSGTPLTARATAAAAATAEIATILAVP